MFYVLNFIYIYILGLLIQLFIFLPSALLFLDVIDRELKSKRDIEREGKRRGRRASKRERESERGVKREREGGEWGEERERKKDRE